MSNFEVFCWNFLSSTNPEIGRSVLLSEGHEIYDRKCQIPSDDTLIQRHILFLNLLHNANNEL